MRIKAFGQLNGRTFVFRADWFQNNVVLQATFAAFVNHTCRCADLFIAK